LELIVNERPIPQNYIPVSYVEIINEKISDLEKQTKKIYELLVPIIKKMSECENSPVRTLEGASSFLKISDSQTRRLVTAGKLRARPLDPDKKSSRLFFDVQDLLQFHHFRHNRRLTPTEKKEFMNKITNVLTIVEQTKGK